MRILKIETGTPEAKALAAKLRKQSLATVKTVSNSVITPEGLQEIKLIIAGRNQ